jgi:putative phosphoribosyl transferase
MQPDDTGKAPILFASREEAGVLLARNISEYRRSGVVLGIPRGGVIVARPVANALGSPFGVAVAKKVRAPQNSELAIGAVAPDDCVYLNEILIAQLAISAEYIRQEVKLQKSELLIRIEKFPQPPPVAKQQVIVIDDGIATGATVMAAALWLVKKNAAEIIVATPVISTEVVELIQPHVARIIALHRIAAGSFGAVGDYYRDFTQVTDKEVVKSLQSRV